MSNASNIFTGLSYNQGKRVTVGAISIPIPDGSRCAMSQPSGEVKSKLSADLRDYLDFACVPESDPRGTDGYQDTDYSITLQKPQTISNLPYAWQSNSVDDVASQLISMIDKNTNPTPYTQSPTVTRKEKGLITGYLRYCGDDTEGEFWRSYTIFILCDEFFESGMFYFNQKAPESVFTTTIRNWLAEVRPASEKSIDDLRAKIGQERLGPYAGQNGKVNALLTARLFAEDVLFFPEQKLDRSGNSVKLNLQVNMQKIIEHPWFIQNGQVFIDAFLELAKDLDGEESLKIPKSRLHPQMLRPLLDDRLTGLSFLNLMAYHMVKIVEADSSGNQYTVMVDRNLAAGIPDVRQYIGKFIKFCRSYNGITGKFSVDFISAMNFDSPISGSLTPVSGADTSFGSLTVDADGSMSQAGNSVLERMLTETIGETASASASPSTKTAANSKSASTNTSNKTNTTKQDQKTKEQKLEEEYNKALEDRKAEIARRTEEEKERLKKILDSEIEQAEKRHEAEINKLNEEKEQKKQKLAELQQELDGLGFLKFKRKSELKDLIAEANRNLNATVRKIDDAEKGHKKSLERSRRAYEINFEDFTRKVEELVPAPKEPEHMIKRREEERKKKELREKEIEEDRLRMIIVDYIRDNGQVTLGEVIKHVNYHRTLDKKDPLSSAEIIKLMKEPKENGYFTHAEINGITYFMT